MKEFEIWMEGYMCTGDSSDAQKIGVSKGVTFKDACINYAEIDKDFKKYFNEENLSYWACKLYDNEQDARKRFK